jgi:hypothetical protein
MLTIRKFGRICEALMLVFLADVLLSMIGGVRTIDLVRRLSCHGKRTTSRDSGSVLQSLRDAYSRAGSLYPRHVECLPRSLTLFMMARRRGIPVVFHVSVRKFPFASHAWVNFNGPLLPNEASLIGSLTTILTIPSC